MHVAAFEPEACGVAPRPATLKGSRYIGHLERDAFSVATRRHELRLRKRHAGVCHHMRKAIAIRVERRTRAVDDLRAGALPRQQPLERRAALTHRENQRSVWPATDRA